MAGCPNFGHVTHRKSVVNTGIVCITFCVPIETLVTVLRDGGGGVIPVRQNRERGCKHRCACNIAYGWGVGLRRYVLKAEKMQAGGSTLPTLIHS